MSDLSAKDHMPPAAAPIKPHSPPDGSMIGMPNLLRSISGKKQLAIASAKPDASKAVTVPNASVPRIGWFAVYRNRFPSRAKSNSIQASKPPLARVVGSCSVIVIVTRVQLPPRELEAIAEQYIRFVQHGGSAVVATYMTRDSNSSGDATAYNMVFTQGHGFVLGESFGLPASFAPLSCVGLPRRGHRLFGNAVSFW